MTRRRKNRSRPSRGGRRGESSQGQIHDRTARVVFSTLATVAVASAPQTIACNPSISNHANTVADGYALYKLVRLRFRLHPGANTGPVAACYIPGVTDTPPVSAFQCSEVPEHVMLSATSTVPSNWCDVPRRNLFSYETWYKTIVGTPDPSTEIQGNIFAVNPSSGSGMVPLEIEGEFMFKNSVPTASTPQMRRDAEWRAEYLRITKALAEGAKLAPPTLSCGELKGLRVP